MKIHFHAIYTSLGLISVLVLLPPFSLRCAIKFFIVSYLIPRDAERFQRLFFLRSDVNLSNILRNTSEFPIINMQLYVMNRHLSTFS